VKQATNGNHYVVLTEGQRDDKSGDVRKTRLFVFSEDFDSFFNLLRDTAEFIKANPLPPAVQKKRERFWAKQAAGSHTPSAKPRATPPGVGRMMTAGSRRTEFVAAQDTAGAKRTQRAGVVLRIQEGG
jgi:hypothetical protein